MTPLAGVVDGLLVRRQRLATRNGARGTSDRLPPQQAPQLPARRAGATSRQAQRRAVRVVALVLALLAVGLGLRDAQERSPAPTSPAAPTSPQHENSADDSPSGTDGDGGSQRGRDSRGEGP